LRQRLLLLLLYDLLLLLLLHLLLLHLLHLLERCRHLAAQVLCLLRREAWRQPASERKAKLLQPGLHILLRVREEQEEACVGHRRSEK